MDCKNAFPITCAPGAPGGGPCPPPPRPPCPPPPHPPFPPCPPPRPIPGGTSQYIGARYVPKFADPVEWDKARSYENFVIVTYNGDCYTSRAFVPAGTDLTNTTYWVKTTDNNYQLEQVKQSVEDLSGQVTSAVQDVAEAVDKVNAMQATVDEIKQTTDTDHARVDAAVEDVAKLSTKVDGFAADLKVHSDDIAALKQADKDLSDRIDDNKASNSATQKELDSFKAETKDDIQKLRESDAAQKADIATNKQNILDNAANIQQNAEEIAAHAVHLDKLEKDFPAEVARLDAKNAEQDGRLDGLDTKTDSIRTDLTQAQANIAQNADNITHLRGDVNRIDLKDAEQDNRLDELDAFITDHSEHLAKVDSRLDELDSKTDKANEDITKNAEELAEHAVELADHEKRITTLEGASVEATDSINAIKQKNVEQDNAIARNYDAIQHVKETAEKKSTIYVSSTEPETFIGRDLWFDIS